MTRRRSPDTPGRHRETRVRQSWSASRPRSTSTLRSPLVFGVGRQRWLRLVRQAVSSGTRFSTRASAGRAKASSSNAAVTAAAPGQHDQKADDLEIVDAVKLAFHRMGAAGVNRLATAALLLLADDRADGCRERLLHAAHVLAVLGSRRSAQAPASGRILCCRAASEAVKRPAWPGKRQQDRAVVADMDDIVRRERVTRLDGLERRLSHGAQAEDDPGRDRGLATFGVVVTAKVPKGRLPAAGPGAP